MADTATVAVLFCDLVASTERQARLGDDAADAFRRRFFGALRAALAAHAGSEIKTLGDGVMAAFESTTAALSCALDMHAAAVDLDAADPVLLRIGVSVGEVGHEDDDWFGLPVVEAARLCAAAAPGQTLATSTVRTVVGSRGSRLRFTDLGRLELKGLPAPVAVVAVDAGDGPTPVRPGHLAIAERDRDVTSLEVVHSASPAGGRLRANPRRAVATIAAAVVVAALVLGGMIVGAGDDAAGDRDRSGNGSRSQGITRPTTYRPSFRSIRCDEEVLAELASAECGQLIVPEWRERPLGRRIHVDVVRAPALGEATSPPVLLVDPNEQLASSPLRQEADVYQVTLRGFSERDQPRLVCPDLSATWVAAFVERATDPGAIERRAAAAGACAERLRAGGVKLQGYNMAEVAADLRDLVLVRRLGRVAVAASGFSTPAAVHFARSHPGAVTSLLLTNPTPPGESTLANPTLHLSKSFDAFAELCRDDDRCAPRAATLRSDLHDRVAQYDVAPQVVATMPLAPGEPGMPVLLDGRRVGAALASAMKASPQVGLIPSALAPGGASVGLLAAAAVNEELLFYAGSDAIGGAVLSFFCSYDVHLSRTSEVADAVLDDFAGANNPGFGALCSAWDVPVVVDGLDQPLDGDLPVLLVEGGLSVSGVNRWSEQMAATLPASTVVRFATLSEDVSFVQPPCLRELRRRFLARPRAPLVVDECEAASPPIEFVGL